MRGISGLQLRLLKRAWPVFQTRPDISLINQDKKVIGYIGSIDNRLDYPLLRKLAIHNPDHSIKLIGRITCDSAYGFANEFENVQLTGAKQPGDLVKELHEVDLGIIPFISDEFTQNIYPLKVNEYLAAGKAVVSTDFAPLDEFEAHISIARNHQSFIDAVEMELYQDRTEKVAERSAWARQNSWENRAEQFSAIIQNILGHHAAA